MCGDGGYKGGEAEVERDAPLLALRILVESGGRDDAARFGVFGFRVFGLGFSSRGTSQIPLLSQPPQTMSKKSKINLFPPSCSATSLSGYPAGRIAQCSQSLSHLLRTLAKLVFPESTCPMMPTLMLRTRRAVLGSRGEKGRRAEGGKHMMAGEACTRGEYANAATRSIIVQSKGG